MKLSKRLLIFVVLMSINSYKSFAYDIEVNGFYYNVLSATTLEVIYGDKKYSGDVSIPATVSYNGKTYNVVSVGKKAFADCENLLSIYMGNNIRSIGDYAFYKCSSLKSYTFFTTTIGNYAFADCKSITSFENSTMERIPEGMFAGCTSLSSISFNALYIGANAFNGCTSLKGAFNFVGHIGTNAFRDCTGITSVTIRTTQNTIGGTVIFNNAFSGCTSLTKITLKNTINSDIVAIQGVGEGFGECPNLKDIIVEQLNGELNYETKDNGLYRSNMKLLSFLAPKRETSAYVTPNELERLGSYSLSTKGNLRRLVLGGTILEILEKAFYNCSELEEIFIYNKKPSEIRINDYLDPNKFGRLKIFVPTGCKSLYEQVSPWKNFIIEEFDVINFDPYEMSEEIDGIKYKITSDTEVEVAQKKDYYSGDIVIPETVSINNKEYKVTSIGKRAFLHCSSLKTIELPNSIIEIGEDAFNLSGIESIKLPHNLRKIGPGSFSWSKLKKIEISEMTERICAHAFRYCSYLDTVIIPNKVTSIGDGAFNSCNLKTVVIGENVNSIGNAAFELSGTVMNIYTLNRTPPMLNVEDNDYYVRWISDEKSTFNYNSYHSTLWVPESSLDEYKNNYYWGKFVNIQTFDPNTFDLTTLGIKTTTNDEEEVNRYSLDGRKLLAPTKGVNIIKMKDGTVKKVFVK